MLHQSFRELGVSARVSDALAARSIHAPFTIQSYVLPDALAGLDVLAKSPTGSGKTLAFAIPIVERTTSRDKRPSALVLVPTRELAVQVTEELLRDRARERPQGRRRLRRHAAPLAGGSRALGQHPRRDARPPAGPGRSPACSTSPQSASSSSTRPIACSTWASSPRSTGSCGSCRGTGRRCSSRPRSTARSASLPGPTRAARRASRPTCPPTAPSARSTTASSR